MRLRCLFRRHVWLFPGEFLECVRFGYLEEQHCKYCPATSIVHVPQ